MTRSLIFDRDIVIVGLQPWDVEIGSNCKNLALEFSQHNRVLYINAALDRRTIFTKKSNPKIKKRLAVVKGQKDGLIQVSENLWEFYPDRIMESINWIPFTSIFDWLNCLNNKRFANCIKEVIGRLNFKNVILFNDNDIFRSFYLKDLLKPSLSIYYSRDYLVGVNYWKRHGQRLEPELIAKSDICVANSSYLTNYCKKHNPSSYYVGQGCDLSDLLKKDSYNLPADIEHLSKPIIGYVGALQSIRIDLNIVEYIATQRPDWNVVLVGPEDNTFKKSKLHDVTNIIFCGAKDQEDLPSYINAFTVCINPQLLNELTLGNYPRKVDEYLAMGKPVVATKTDGMELFKDFTYLGRNKEDYVTLIEKAIQEDSSELQENRRKFASLHTWEQSAAEIYQAIQLKEQQCQSVLL